MTLCACCIFNALINSVLQNEETNQKKQEDADQGQQVQVKVSKKSVNSICSDRPEVDQYIRLANALVRNHVHVLGRSFCMSRGSCQWSAMSACCGKPVVKVKRRTGFWQECACSVIGGLLCSSCCLVQLGLNSLSIGCAGFSTLTPYRYIDIFLDPVSLTSLFETFEQCLHFGGFLYCAW